MIGRRVAQIRHKYRNGGAIDLQFFVVRGVSRAAGEPRSSTICGGLRCATLPEYDFLAADLGLIRDSVRRQAALDLLSGGQLRIQTITADQRQITITLVVQPGNGVEPADCWCARPSDLSC